MLKSEFKILESFSNFLNEKSNKNTNEISSKNKDTKDVTGIKIFYKSLQDELRLINYFRFIPKSKSDGKLRLAIDMNSLFKYSQLQSYIIGVNCLYFSLIFIKSRNALSISSVLSILISTGITFYIFRFNYNKILSVMDFMFNEDTKELYEKTKREEIGFDFNLQDNFIMAEKQIKQAENDKYEDVNKKVFKKEYLSKTYSLEERSNLLDLIKFYSDWLYSPVDENLENKMYFLDLEEKQFIDHFYNKLKEEYDDIELENKIKLNKVFGLKINEKI